MEDDLKNNNSHNLFSMCENLATSHIHIHLMAAKDDDGNLKTAPDEVLKCWETYLRNILT